MAVKAEDREGVILQVEARAREEVARRGGYPSQLVAYVHEEPSCWQVSLLRKHGTVVTPAPDGSEVIQIRLGGDYDVVLSKKKLKVFCVMGPR